MADLSQSTSLLDCARRVVAVVFPARGDQANALKNALARWLLELSIALDHRQAGCTKCTGDKESAGGCIIIIARPGSALCVVESWRDGYCVIITRQHSLVLTLLDQGSCMSDVGCYSIHVVTVLC